MNNNQSEDEYEAGDHYSDNFEDELEDESADEIRVYKSCTGPTLTIQPRPKKYVPLLTPRKTESDGNLVLKKGPQIALPTRKSTKTRNPRKTVDVQTSVSSIHSNHGGGGESGSSAERELTEVLSPRRFPPKRATKFQPRPTASYSKTILSVHPLTPTNRQLVSTETRKYSSNNYSSQASVLSRGKRFAVSPYHVPPMRLGPAKAGNVAQRVASAQRMTINDMKNRISQLLTEIEDVKKENRALTHIQNRQNQALRRWEGQDADLPILLQRHKDEMRTSQDLLRKANNHIRELEDRLKLKDKKIARMQVDLQKLKALAADEHLQERTELQNNLEMVSANLAGAEMRIRQYMRHTEILEKNHQHQVAAEQQKLIRANKHALELRQEIAMLKLSLREKDRMLNYIQMRSAGRNLMRSFKDQERARNPTLTDKEQNY